MTVIIKTYLKENDDPRVPSSADVELRAESATSNSSTAPVSACVHSVTQQLTLRMRAALELTTGLPSSKVPPLGGHICTASGQLFQLHDTKFYLLEDRYI